MSNDADLPEYSRMLKGIRQQRGWSQHDLAAELGVSRRTIARWEAGHGDPHPGRMAFIRQLLVAAGLDSEEAA